MNNKSKWSVVNTRHGMRLGDETQNTRWAVGASGCRVAVAMSRVTTTGTWAVVVTVAVVLLLVTSTRLSAQGACCSASGRAGSAGARHDGQSHTRSTHTHTHTHSARVEPRAAMLASDLNAPHGPCAAETTLVVPRTLPKSLHYN